MFTGRRQTDDGQQVIKKAHLNLGKGELKTRYLTNKRRLQVYEIHDKKNRQNSEISYLFLNISLRMTFKT